MKFELDQQLDIAVANTNRRIQVSDVPPDGTFFVCRLLLKGKQKYGYTPFVITPSGDLWYQASNNHWCFFRKASDADRSIVSECFRTIDELMELRIGA